MLRDFHTHTCFSDGVNTPEEMVLSAIEKGLELYGISDHGYAPHDSDVCIKEGDVDKYIAEMQRLKAAYEGRIKLFCGIEQDIYMGTPDRDYDYVIGSVHYVKPEDSDFQVVDNTFELVEPLVKDYYCGDYIAYAEAYFREVGTVYERTGCDIIGHFDLLTKFNEKHPVIDLHNTRYVAAWQNAVDKLLKAEIPFEINTGAISKGHRTSPYPQLEIAQYITEKGGRLIMSSDSHKAETITYEFDKWRSFYTSRNVNIVDFDPSVLERNRGK